MFYYPGNTNPRVIYCAKFHKDGEHDQSCIPAAEPENKELRLIRAIWGLCPDCNRTDEHEHPCRMCGKEQPLPDGSYCYHER